MALGFGDVKIAKVEVLVEPAKQLEKWLRIGYHGEMSYMANHFEMRIDPSKLVPGSKSVISLMYNYFPTAELKNSRYKISKYAYGKDYHKVIKRKLKQLIQQIRQEIGEIEGRAFVDSAPVMEREWAKRSGIGWIGKHTLLLSKNKGSFFFLAELIIDLELKYDTPVLDHCGNCRRCIDACPTKAISDQGYILDSNRCISYLTIEQRNLEKKLDHTWADWIFGCDICQDVCPWNRFSVPHIDPNFEPILEMKYFNTEDWDNLIEDDFNSIMGHTPLKRAGFSILKRNIAHVK